MSPRLKSKFAQLLTRIRNRGDGLCHAYAEYEGLDCLRPKGHEHSDDGHHGDVT